jgi:oligosaccharide repeat unit polymerase
MLITTSIALLALTALTLIAAKNTLFPPTLFCASWVLTLLALILAGRSLYDVGEYACLVFLVGAVAFSFGGVLDLCITRHQPPRQGTPTAKITRTALDFLLLFLVAFFPYYVRVALSIADTADEGLVLATIRQSMVDSELEGASPFGVVAGNVAVLAPLVALAMFYETDGTWSRRWRALLSVLLALAYGALTGSKAGAWFLMTLFFVAQIRAGRIRIASGLVTASVVLGFSVAGIILINLPKSTVDDTRAAASVLGDALGAYWLGAPVAFGAVVERPHALASSQNIGRFFMETVRSVGMPVDLPSIHQKYTAVGPGISTNVYTIYFSYFKDYGWLGVVLLLGGLGAFLTMLWRRALRGAPVAVLMYAMMCKAIVLSYLTESFFLGLNSYIKAFMVYWLLYGLLPSLRIRGINVSNAYAD